MQAQALTPFVQQSQAASQVILGPFALMQGVKKLGSTIVFYVLVLVLSPILLLVACYLGFILRKALRKLTKALESPIELSSENYFQFRQEFDTLKKLRHRILAMNLPELSSMDKATLNLFKVGAFVDLFNTRIHKLDLALNALNPVQTNQDHLLKPVSEEELWHNRTTAYAYLI